jgi:hypothetical protein
MGGVLELWLLAGGQQIRVHGHRLPFPEVGAEIFVSVDPQFIRVVE